MQHCQDIYELKHHPCVLAVIENPENGQLLMVENLRGINQGFCNFPGGKVDLGESITDALQREVFEETGLKLKSAKCIGRIDIMPEDAKDSPDALSVSDNMHVYVFYSNKYIGELLPAKGEVEIFWQDKESIPYEKMRDNDKLWVPDALRGQTFHKFFFRGKDGQLKETWNDDEDVESMLDFRLRQYEMIKSVYKNR